MITREVEDLCGENYSEHQEANRINEADRSGMEIVGNSDTVLTFDLDGEDALKTFRDRVGLLDKKGFVPSYVITRSKSGNYHAVVTITASRTLTEPLRLVIQACLGSDWKREILGVLRILNNQPQVSMLFRPQPLEIVETYNQDEPVLFVDDDTHL